VINRGIAECPGGVIALSKRIDRRIRISITFAARLLGLSKYESTGIAYLKTAYVSDKQRHLTRLKVFAKALVRISMISSSPHSIMCWRTAATPLGGSHHGRLRSMLFFWVKWGDGSDGVVRDFGMEIQPF
jgi:hypothetical protein